MTESVPAGSGRDLLLAFVDSRPEDGFPDELTTLAQLRRFQADADDADLMPARQVRDELARVLLGPRDIAAAVLGDLGERLRVRPDFRSVGVIGWRVENGGRLTPLLADLMTAAIELWASGDLEDVHVCEAQSCIVPFVDASPRRNRHYCSDTCATRTRVQRHRRGASSGSS